MTRTRDVDEIFNVEALEGINLSMSAPFRKLSNRLFNKKKKKKNCEERTYDEAPGEEAAGEPTPDKATKSASDEEENDSLSSLKKPAPPVDSLHPLRIIEGPDGPILPHKGPAGYRPGIHRAVARVIIEAHQRPDPGPSYQHFLAPTSLFLSFRVHLRLLPLPELQQLAEYQPLWQFLPHLLRLRLRSLGPSRSYPNTHLFSTSLFQTRPLASRTSPIFLGPWNNVVNLYRCHLVIFCCVFLYATWLDIQKGTREGKNG
ncbi:hypothetical protein HL42_1452 [Trichophyton rubrum]|nr:hypothetical protein HL42_1452 [Trichophyton rubrum]